MELRNKIINILLNCLDIIETHEHLITMDLINDLGMDSLTFVELIVLLEDEFGVEIPLENLEMENFRTLEKIETIVNMILNKGE